MTTGRKRQRPDKMLLMSLVSLSAAVTHVSGGSELGGLGLDGRLGANPSQVAESMQTVICPPGTFRSRGETSVQVSACLPCPHGTYSDDWSENEVGEACKICPGGSFGAQRGLASDACSGRCEPGYFCPPGSKSGREKACGGNEWFCPAGSVERVAVTPGYYSTSLIQTSSGMDSNTDLVGGNHTRSAQAMCEPGHWCEMGVRRPCPRGSYNAEFGSSSDDDCVLTSPGFYARQGAAKQTECPPGTFAANSNSSECSDLCETGHYCESNSVSATQAACAAGLAGGKRGLPSDACSALCSMESGYCVQAASQCPQGYYCPDATSEPIPCGGSHFYCPAGSPAPVAVTTGHYSIGGESAETRTAQRICPLGHYCVTGIKQPCPFGYAGTSQGLSNRECSGACEAGYFCEIGSSSLRQKRCGSPDRFCPSGSAKTYPVSTGYYLIGGDATTREAETPCPVGHHCERGIKIACPAGTFGPDESLAACLACPMGHYCPKASVRPIKCPAGTFGAEEGLRDAACSGACKAGYFCLEAAVNAEQYMCSASTDVPQKDPAAKNGAYGADEGVYYGDAHGVAGSRPRDSVYCPAGSGGPQTVASGFFAAGGKAGARTHQLECDQTKRQWDASACASLMSF